MNKNSTFYLVYDKSFKLFFDRISNTHEAIENGFDYAFNDIATAQAFIERNGFSSEVVEIIKIEIKMNTVSH